METNKHKSILDIIEGYLKIIALVLAGVWAVYVFYYEKIYLEEQNPSFLNITSKVEKVGNIGCNSIYEVEITFQNKSKKKEKLVASWYHIVASNFSFSVSTASDSGFVKGNIDYLDSLDRFARYYEISSKKSKTIETGRLFDQIWLNPEQETTIKITTALPKNKFKLLTCYLYGVTAEKDKNVDVLWRVANDTGEVTPQITLRDSKNNIVGRDIFEVDKESSYIEKYGLVFTRVYSDKYVK